MDEKKTFRYIRAIKTEMEVSVWLPTGSQVVVTSNWRGGCGFDVTGYEYSLDNEDPVSVSLASNVSLTRARKIVNVLRAGEGDLKVRIGRHEVRVQVGKFAVCDEVSSGPLYWYPNMEKSVRTHRKLSEYPVLYWYSDESCGK